MHWNYRVVRKDYEHGPRFDIHEVYYDDDDKINGWSDDPVSPSGDTLAALKQDLAYMKQALRRPLLTQVTEEDGTVKLSAA